MNIHRFTAPDMRQAIRQVRREFGPDAVILKSEKFADGVRVICGTDFDEKQLDTLETVHMRQLPRDAADSGREVRKRAGAAPAATAKSQRPPEPAPQPERQAAPPPAPQKDAAAEDAELRAMRRELRSIRGLLSSELATLTQSNLEQNQPLRADILRKFKLMGLDTALSKRLTEGAAKVHSASDAWRVTLTALTAAVPRAEFDLMARGGRIALYGPAGVGKTTAVVRLASQFAARHGRQSVGLVSADSRRPGAQTEMLRRGQQLGVYTLAVSSPGETREAIEVLGDRRLILIDTAAMTPRDAQLAEQVALLRSLPQVRPWLVLSSTTQARALRDMVHNMASLRPSACILTRLDECVALGESLSVLVECGLPVSFASTGPERIDCLKTASPDWLVRSMVHLWKTHRGSQLLDVDSDESVYAEVARSGLRADLSGV